MKCKITLGGGCHWCTEAVFQALRGVVHVDQGWASAKDDASRFSEAVTVTFNPTIIPLKVVIEIHLYTHSSTSQHGLRKKYRSAVYVHTSEQVAEVEAAIADGQTQLSQPIVTEVVSFSSFRQNVTHYQNYYQNRRDAPFCTRYIIPKLQLLQKKYSQRVKAEIRGEVVKDS